MSDIYDVALSFAGEQRAYVRAVAEALVRAHNLTVFYDEFFEAEILGKDLGDLLDEVYRKRSRFVVICISKEYREKKWTNHERKSAFAAAIDSDSEKVLPLRFDDTELPGLRSTTAYLSAQRKRPTEVAEVLATKISRTREIRHELVSGIRLWRIVSQRYAPHAFSGQGSRRYGGRWTSSGTPVVYCASSLCLALMEMRFNLALGRSRTPAEPELQMLAIEAQLPPTTRVKHVYENEVPENWTTSTQGKWTRAIGDLWARDNSLAILSVPSAIVPGERIYLLNPQHPDVQKLVIVSEKKIAVSNIVSL